MAVFVLDRYQKPVMPCSENRTTQQGWIAPSVRHRMGTTWMWVHRLRQWTPVVGIVQELVRFDLQQMENSTSGGIEYQQGTLAGYEVREYLVEKGGRECAYCGAQKTPLQIEPIYPRAKGGSHRIANLTLACQPCNKKKNTQELHVFVANDSKRWARLQAQAKAPFKDAAALNTTRGALFHAVKATGGSVTTGAGGLTTFNRLRLAIPQTPALDAAGVGPIDALSAWNRPTLAIKATGRGSYQRTRLDAFGFPRGYLTRQKRIRGFQSGDQVKAAVKQGKKSGTYIGRVAVRATGSFNLQTANGLIQGISYRYCKLLHRCDGYGYHQTNRTEVALRATRYPSSA